MVLSAITTLQPRSASAELSETEGTPEDSDDSEATAAASSSHARTKPAAKSSRRITKRPGRMGTVRLQGEGSGYTVLVQLPAWISEVVWELQTYRACSTTTVRFRQYRYRAAFDSLFNYIADGNIDKVREMFNNGEASPFDRSPWHGATLLHVRHEKPSTLTYIHF